MAQPAGAEQDYCRTTVAAMHKLTTGHKTVKKKKKKKEHSFCRSKFEFGTRCTSALLYTTVQLQLSIKDTLSVRTFETLTKYVLIRPLTWVTSGPCSWPTARKSLVPPTVVNVVPGYSPWYCGFTVQIHVDARFAKAT